MAKTSTKIKCELCGKEISKSNYSKHLRRHEVHPETFKESYHLDHDDLFCKYCGKECQNKNSLVQHEIRCKCNPNKCNMDITPREGFNNKGRVAWNKGLTKETDERVLKSANTYIENEKLGLHKSHSFPRTAEQREKLSVKMKEIYSNKDVSVAGRSKMGWYKGIYCNSSWELAYVIYNLDHHIKFIRNKRGFKYMYNGSEHTYFPDFYLIEDSTYVEIKGYKDTKSEAKINQFNDRLIVLQYPEMKPILEYVITNYGEDFISLYEDK